MADQNNQVQLKNFNRRTVLGYIRRNGTATKAGLASVTGLTFMAIKKILAELQELNLISDGQMESGGMCRKAVSYVINENYRYTIGIHINKFITGIALLNLRGHILAIERYSMDKEFEPELYHDEYQIRLRQIIEAKINGQEIVNAPAEHQDNVIDIMEALQRSLAQVSDNKPPTKRKPRKKAATA